jgi:hypothetical protein
MHLIL